MTDTTDKVAFAAAELIAASDALASAAAEVDALRAEVTRQTWIAVDHCARADAAEQMVVELGAIIKEAADDIDREDKRHVATGDTYDTTYVTETLKRGIAALSRTEAVAGRWVTVDAVEIVRMMLHTTTAERDAAIAARDEAVASCKEWGDSFDALYAECAAAERARDEVGIQLAAAQARIKLLEEGVELLRHIDEFKGEPKWGPNGINTYRVSCDVIDIGVGSYLTHLDAVPGDALAPKITAALEASGIDTDNVKGVE